MEIYSTHNEGKSGFPERFIRSLKNKVYKHTTVLWKNIYFDVLNDIVDKYSNTYDETFKMKLIDVKYNSYAKYNVNSNDKDPIFKIGDYVRMSKYKNYKNIFC